MSRKLKPVSPGEMLAEEFLKPLALSSRKCLRADLVVSGDKPLVGREFDASFPFSS